MIDPALDLTAYLMLCGMTPGKHTFVGRSAAFDLLSCTPKPVMVIVATDAPIHEVDNVKKMALMKCVPVVHALGGAWLGKAMGSPIPETCVTVMQVPHHSRKVAANLMERAADACAMFTEEVMGRTRSHVDTLSAQLAHTSL